MADKAIILVHALQYIEPTCDATLREAERIGFTVWRNFGNESQDIIKCSMAQEALDKGFTELIWVEPDIAFTLEKLVKIRELKKPVFTALYPIKGTNEVVGNITEHNKKTGDILFNQAGCGFLYTRAEVYHTIVAKMKLTKCSYLGKNFYPWFMPFIEKNLYYSEVMSFCYRLGKSGFKIEAHEDLTVDHIGNKPWKISVHLDKYPYFLRLPEHDTYKLAEHQQHVDQVTSKSLSMPYKKVWSKIMEIPRIVLAQGTACSYNPSIVRHKGQLWMFYRHDAKTALHCTTWQERRPIGIRAVRLDNSFQPIEGTDQPIIIPPTWNDVCMEDPKVMSDGEHVWVSVVEPNLEEGYQSKWVIGVNISKHVLENGKFVCLQSGMPPFGNNPGLEKNWAPFIYDGKVMLNYSMNPHVVFNHDNPTEVYKTPGVSWNFGEIIHGGTPPVKVGHEYFSFLHAKTEYPHLLQRPIHYMIGCVAFEAHPPFKITKFTKQPILWSDLSIDVMRPISCVFPGGALYDMETKDWTVSYGHNDMACRMLTVPHKALLEVMDER